MTVNILVVYWLCHDQTLCQIWAQSSSSRRSNCHLNIWPYDLEHVSRVALCSVIVCTKFKLSQAIRSWNVTVFWCQQVVTLYDLDLWPVDLDSFGRSGVTRSQSVLNLIEIEQFQAELLIISSFLPLLRHVVTLTFDPLILNVYGRSGIIWSI